MNCASCMHQVSLLLSRKCVFYQAGVLYFVHSLIEFFKKIKKWQEMAKLAHDFQKKIDTLERKFEVASIIFSKYNRVFHDLFSPLDEKPVASNRRGGRRKHG